MMRYLIVLLLTLCMSVAVAQTDNGSKFSLEHANRTFDAMSIRLSTQNLKAASFDAAISELADLRNQAESCSVAAKNGLNQVNTQLAEVSPTATTATPDNVKRADVAYLLKKKEDLTQREAACRLFVLRADEALKAYRDTLLQLTKSELLVSGVPIWRHWANPGALFGALNIITLKVIWDNLGATSQQNWWLGFSLLLLAIILGIGLRFVFRQRLQRVPETASRLERVLWYNLKYYSPFILPGLVVLGFMLVSYWNAWFSAPVSLVAGGLIVYLVYHIVTKLILYPYPFLNKEPSKTQLIKRALYRRMNVLGVITLVGGIIYYLLVINNIALALTQTVHVIVVTLLTIVILWIIWLFNRLLPHKILTGICGLLFTAICLLMIIAEWLGYYPLSEYLLVNIFLTVFGLLGVILLTKLIDGIVWGINGKEYDWQHAIHRLLGTSHQRSLPEMILFKIVGIFVIWMAYITFILEVWGRNSKYPDHFLDALIHGFRTAHIPIMPSRIVIACLVFIALILFGRWISSYIARRYQPAAERDAQVAIASITGYVIFGVALIVGLIVAGVNFTGLAIIAGALSVGIGLGLQDIVNNFVSGIILLLEKPIRPGDRVVIGETEGFVKKVRVRSTQISTMAKSDVIVPNADLIKNQVTNYMFRDRNWRVVAKVGVAYGSDVEKVKKVMLTVAHTHPDIVTTPPDDPIVLFRQFGDSSLIFEIWCVISDVNKKYMVESDLHFGIDAAFRKNGITIAFPQRDVHIYDGKLPVQPTSKKTPKKPGPAKKSDKGGEQ